MTEKKNTQDATLRNVRATRKHEVEDSKREAEMKDRIDDLERRVSKIEEDNRAQGRG